MDRVRWYYYFKNGFSLEKELSLPSFTEVMAYWKPFEVHAVENILVDFPDAIIDFGAGHSYFTEEAQMSAVKRILDPIANIFLLLPSEDKEESLRICNERLKDRAKRELEPSEIESNRDFVFHRSNYELAKKIVYTKEKTPEEVALEIQSLLIL